MDRIAKDGYFTPEALALALTKRVSACVVLADPIHILEPSSGGGAFVRAACAVWPTSEIVAVDVAPTARMFSAGAEFTCCDFLAWRAIPFDLIIGNPPYGDAEAHVQHALKLLRPGGTVAFLLRLSFLASQRRMRGVCSGPGRYVAPIGPRPSFTGGGSDNSEYGLFCWTPDARDRAGESKLGEPIFWGAP